MEHTLWWTDTDGDEQMVDGFEFVFGIMGSHDGSHDIRSVAQPFMSGQLSNMMVTVRHLTSQDRLPFTATYFGSIGLTLYFAVGVSRDMRFSTPETDSLCIASKHNTHINLRHRAIGCTGLVSRLILPHGIHRTTICSTIRRSEGGSVVQQLMDTKL